MSLLALKDGRQPAGPDGSEQPTTDDEGEEREDRHIRCRSCGVDVTEEDAVVRIGGEDAVQCFANPSGILFELLTVGYAWNLRAVGPRTTEFTWFGGYTWRIVLCFPCGAHLGWLFEAVGSGTPTRFYGLVLPRLTR